MLMPPDSCCSAICTFHAYRRYRGACSCGRLAGDGGSLLGIEIEAHVEVFATVGMQGGWILVGSFARGDGIHGSSRAGIRIPRRFPLPFQSQYPIAHTSAYFHPYVRSAFSDVLANDLWRHPRHGSLDSAVFSVRAEPSQLFRTAKVCYL